MTSENFEIALDDQSHDNVAIFYEEIKEDVICVVNEKLIYYFNKNTTLYEQITLLQISTIIKTTLNKFLNKFTTNNKKKLEKISKLISKLGNVDYRGKVAKAFTTIDTVQNKDFPKLLDIIGHVINFKNGYVNLTNGIFHIRNSQNYFSKSLNYDYNTEKNLKTMEKINKMFFNICNDKKDMSEHMKSICAYSITGENNIRAFFALIGHLASNGKTTLMKMLYMSLPIYGVKLDKRTFNTDYQKSHKQYSLLKAPVRWAYVEELEKGKKLDTDALKELVSGGTINVERLYETEAEQFQICTKLFLLSNFYPNLETENGVIDRGRLYEYKNKFVELKDYKPTIKGMYLRDDRLDEFLATVDFKISYFNILLPYCIQFYKTRQLLPFDSAKIAFKDVCQESDKVNEHIKTYYIKTDNPADKIHKNDFVECYRRATNLNLIQFPNILNDLKRLGFIYKKNISTNGKQGCIVGLKKKPIDKFIQDEDEDENDNDNDNDNNNNKNLLDYEFVIIKKKKGKPLMTTNKLKTYRDKIESSRNRTKEYKLYVDYLKYTFNNPTIESNEINEIEEEDDENLFETTLTTLKDLW